MSLRAWTPLIVVGFIACIGLSLAMGFYSGVLAQYDTATLRDGHPGLPPRTDTAAGPLRASQVVSTGYGPLVVTVIWGEPGQQLGLPGIPVVGGSGTVLVSPAVLVRSQDDWTGELGIWLGDRPLQVLPDTALAHPHEMVIVEFTQSVPSGIERRFHPIRSGRGWEPDTSFIVMGLLVLILPSVALARAGAAVHLNFRSRRYALLRMLGTPPLQLAMAIAADMATPLLAGAAVGSLAYWIAMSLLDSFSIAGSSYWTRDMTLPLTIVVILLAATVAVGLLSVTRVVNRASRDPIGTLQRERRRSVSYLPFVAMGGAVAAPIAVMAASAAESSLSVWLIASGCLLSIIGLEGFSRIAIAITGRVLVGQTRMQVSGSRMSRSGTDSVLAVSATSVAVLLIVFFAYSNFDNRPPSVGSYDLAIELPNVTSSESMVREVSNIDGVTRVVSLGRIPLLIDGTDTSLYTMTCHDVSGSVNLDSPCTVGSIYLAKDRIEGDTVTVTPHPLFVKETDDQIPGVYPLGGQVTASWIAGERDEAVLIVDQHPTSFHTLVLVTTNGDTSSLRRIIETLRNRPEESYPTTRAALTAGITTDTLIVYPFLFVMATTAACMAVVALFYAILLLFRQRQAEFRMLRCQGATGRLLAIDLGLLFAIPLSLAFGLAVCSGTILAVSYNAAFGASAPQWSPQVAYILFFALAVGVVGTASVSGLATRIPPLVTDPDAATG